MNRAKTIKLSVCSCGFPALAEDIPLGTEYIVHPDKRCGALTLTCGGCGNVFRNIPCIFVEQCGASVPGFLPAEIFEIGEEIKPVEDDGRVKVFGFHHQYFERIDLPIGNTCFYCEEMIVPGDTGFSLISVCPLPDCSLTPSAHRVYEHRACFLRGIFGSVAHIEKRCSCYVPGSPDSDNDPEGLTRRQAAEAAMLAYQKVHEAIHNDAGPET